MNDGFDFDGVIRKLPYPFKIYMKKVSANDPISRAGLAWIKDIVSHVIERIPAIVDPEIYEIIMRALSKDGDVYIISGRRASGCQRMHDFLRKYRIEVKGVACRGDLNMSEAEFKLGCCKRLKLSTYYEDRPPVAHVLSKNGVKVVVWKS